MKCLLVLSCAVALASAQFGRAPQYRRPAAPARPSSGDQASDILRFENEINPDGSYSYSYESNNGISAQEQGTPRNLGGNPPVAPIVAQGSYSFTSPEGIPVSISYVADENGYQPQGDLLPVAPPIPPQIARALEWLSRNAQKKK